MKEFIELEMIYYLQMSFHLNGVEGTLETIERVYEKSPKLKEEYIKTFWKIIKKEV